MDSVNNIFMLPALSAGKGGRMSEKRIFISNEPMSENIALEETMANLAETLEAQIQIIDFDADLTDASAAPIIILCNNINIQDEAVLDTLEQIYRANQHIILYEPTNNEINTVYARLEGREYFKADNKVTGYSLFGLKMTREGICYVLEAHEKDPELLSRNMSDFMENHQELDTPVLESLRLRASDALELSGSDINLATIARQHVVTNSFSLLGKPCSVSYYMVSCHKYKGTSVSGGEDWFFIQQTGILNGAKNYQKYWAGTRVSIDDESWYVGQGEVCLNYVDYYTMKNYIPTPPGESAVDVQLVYAEPQAINGTTTYTISESLQLSGSIGFESTGKESKGSASFSVGAGFDSSYSFEVRDCTCIGTSLDKNSHSAEWKYQFKHAQRNMAAGKWQYLHDPATLACSVFSPVNAWVWKFDTEKRDRYQSFQSETGIGIMNTISRYSGSQPCKDIPGKYTTSNPNSISHTITFHMPPLLGVDKKSLMFDKAGGTQKLQIAVQGSFQIRFANNPSWIRVDRASGSGELSEVFVSVDEYMEKKERLTVLQIYRVKDAARGTTDELLEVKVIQTSGKIS